NTVDSMFLAYWSDTDLGNGNDDFSGCDTALSLGYTYNGDPFDETYGVPPADGYDFFQGPIVRGDPADSAIFDFQYRYGYKNLPMTAFTFYINGSAVYTDPTLGSPVGATQMYRYMNGLVGNTGQPFIDPLTGQPTKFCLAGDPLTGKGWLDGIVAQPGDRRMLMSSGPFTMAPGDTQEIVVAILIAQGSDRLSSVAVLKFYDKVAQQAYDNFFSLPTPPPAPHVRAIELDKKVVLDWGEDVAAVAATEHFSGKGFSFEGYNVYQMPSPSASREESKLLATYDKKDGVLKVWDYVFDAATGTIIQKPVQFGNDYGIQRSFVLDRDYLTDRALVNGTKYYVAVTSYAYNPDPNAVPNNLENPLQSQVLTVVPHSPNPGVAYYNAPGDTLKVTHSSGISDGQVNPIVVDPSALTGHQYKVTFDTVTVAVVSDHDTTFEQRTKWVLTDVTTGQVVFTSFNQSGGLGVIGSDNYYPMINGMLVEVLGPPPGMKDWEIPSGARRWTWANAAFGFEGFGGAIGWASPYNVFTTGGPNTAVPADKVTNVLIKFASTDTDGNLLDPNDPNASYAYRYGRLFANPPAKPEFAPYIKNKQGGYSFQDYTKSMPFAAYNVDVSPPQRLAVGYLENNAPKGMVDGKYWPPSYDAGDNIASNGPREWFFIFNAPYTDQTPDPALEQNILTNPLPVMWWGTPCRRGNVAFSSNDEFLIIANHVNSVNDVFTFTATAPTVGDVNLAKAEVEKINVWPNPYFGFNTQELNKYQRFVTFNHLPQRATIRIYTLAGIPVRTIEKNDRSQFATWDLLNSNKLPVASGMYIIYIDMPDLGKTKVLKLGVIMEAQFLDRI
ncbi:MAG: T9SS type A sorting domain-containing protein, partial [Bacteroidota bacterium]